MIFNKYVRFFVLSAILTSGVIRCDESRIPDDVIARARAGTAACDSISGVNLMINAPDFLMPEHPISKVKTQEKNDVWEKIYRARKCFVEQHEEAHAQHRAQNLTAVIVPQIALWGSVAYVAAPVVRSLYTKSLAPLRQIPGRFGKAVALVAFCYSAQHAHASHEERYADTKAIEVIKQCPSPQQAAVIFNHAADLFALHDKMEQQLCNDYCADLEKRGVAQWRVRLAREYDTGSLRWLRDSHARSSDRAQQLRDAAGALK